MSRNKLKSVGASFTRSRDHMLSPNSMTGSTQYISSRQLHLQSAMSPQLTSNRLSQHKDSQLSAKNLNYSHMSKDRFKSPLNRKETGFGGKAFNSAMGRYS